MVYPIAMIVTITSVVAVLIMPYQNKFNLRCRRRCKLQDGTPPDHRRYGCRVETRFAHIPLLSLVVLAVPLHRVRRMGP